MTRLVGWVLEMKVGDHPVVVLLVWWEQVSMLR